MLCLLQLCSDSSITARVRLFKEDEDEANDSVLVRYNIFTRAVKTLYVWIYI